MKRFSEKSRPEKILDTLPQYHDGKFGLAIFRISYQDDVKWSQFMDRQTTYVHTGVKFDEHGDKLKESFTWDILEDKDKFSGASMKDIRGHFSQWLESIGRKPGVLTRYCHCIYADEEVIESVLEGEDPETDPYRHSLTAFVKILFASFSETPYQLTPEDEPDEELRLKLNSGDEGYSPLDGCRRHDVGWMKGSAGLLVPSIYWRLMDSGWYLIYERPPEIVMD